MASAWKTFVVVLLVLGTVTLVGFAGLAGAIVFMALTASGRIGSRVSGKSNGSRLYAETFAVWMAALTTLSLAAIFLPNVRDHRLLYSSAASLLSLTAIAWPVLRGMPWAEVRRDIGFYLPARPWRDVLWGVVCYVSNLPVVVAGAMVTLLLLRVQQIIVGPTTGFEEPSAPSHPVIEWVANGNAMDRAAIFVLACVIAPIVEEDAVSRRALSALARCDIGLANQHERNRQRFGE